jgi:hypothetical protein
MHDDIIVVCPIRKEPKGHMLIGPPSPTVYNRLRLINDVDLDGARGTAIIPEVIYAGASATGRRGARTNSLSIVRILCGDTNECRITSDGSQLHRQRGRCEDLR